MYESTKTAVINTVEPAFRTVYSVSEHSIQKMTSTIGSKFSSQTVTTSTSTHDAATFNKDVQTTGKRHNCCLHKDQPCPTEEDGTLKTVIVQYEYLYK